MALQVKDRVAETSTTTGTGALTLDAAITGYRRFSAVCSVSDTLYYAIIAVDANGNPSGDWECGLGTYSSANTLTRTTPQASTNGGAAVNFAAGTKYVLLDATATYLETAYRAGGTDVAVADGGTGASTAAAAATNLGLGTGDSPQFTAINIGHASDTTVTRTGAGDIAVEGNAIYRAGGTDVPVTDGGTGSSTAAGARTNLSAAGTSQTAEQISGFIASPTNKSYTIGLDMKHAGTITEVTTKSASGTCTATWKINTTALGGTANSVSSSEQTQSHSSSNAFAAGDDIVLTVSSNSSCADMSFTIKYTRTLA